MAEINVLSLSYGKDSLACLGACEQLGIPIHRIVHAEVWATDEISADLPPMVEFKKKADAIINERWGIEVEHICAMTTPEKKWFFYDAPLMVGAEKHTNGSSTPQQTLESTECTSTDSLANEGHGVNTSNQMMKLTYEDIFYRPIKNPRKRERERERRYGFPVMRGQWCTGVLKGGAIRISEQSLSLVYRNAKGGAAGSHEETLFELAPTTGGRNKYCCKSIGHSS